MSVTIGSHRIGEGHPAYVIAEIGLNHNGSVDLAMQLIDVAADAGAQAVKFQKRTPAISTPEHMKSVMRETPWGEMTYLEYRYRVEFDREQYIEIGDYATLRGLDWFASPWDVPAVDVPRGPQRRRPQGGVGERHRPRAAARAGRDRQADHPVHRDVDDGSDRPRPSRCSAPTTWCCCTRPRPTRCLPRRRTSG